MSFQLLITLPRLDKHTSLLWSLYNANMYCFIVQVPGFTYRHYTMLEKPARNKHSRLFSAYKNYEENKVL